ncbi:MAG: hypothetical protein GX447_00015 [Elusimicrobia bacterium]|nr:hypothetical protein [Elusimicrobiota bacterium]
MSVSGFLFYIFSAGAVLGSLYILSAKNPMKAAFSMLFVFLCTGLIYLTQGLFFTAAAQIIIYAGAVMSLFVVALPSMVFSKNPEKKRLLFSAAAISSAVLLFYALFPSKEDFALVSYLPSSHTIKDLALVLFNSYWLQIEIISIILFAAAAAAYLFISVKKEAK